VKGLRWLMASILVATGVGARTDTKTDSLGDPLPLGAIQRLGSTRMTYPAMAVPFCYLSDDRALVANSNQLEIVDLSLGKSLIHYRVGSAAIKSMAVKADGLQVVLVDVDGDIAIWDLGKGRELRRWSTGQKDLSSVSLSPDDQRALTTGRVPATLKEWDLATVRERICLNGPQESFFLTVYNKAEGASPADGVTIPSPVQFSMGIYGPGGTTAFVGDSAQASLLHYDLATGRLIHQWYPDIYTQRLALSPDGKRLLIGSRHRGTEWNLEGYQFLQVFNGHHGDEVTAVAYCREPDQILTGSRDGSIRRWNRLTSTVLLRWVAHQRMVSGLAVSPDGKRCLSFGAGALVESELQTGAPRLEWDRHRAPVLATVFIPSSNQVVSSSADGSIRLWDAATGKTLRQFVWPAEALSAYALAVSPDGTRLAAGGYQGLCEFSLADGRQTRALKGHRGFIHALAYSPDGQHLVSGADDGSIKVWSTNSLEPIAHLEGHQGGVLALAISADGKKALSGGRDGRVRCWDLENFKLLNIYEGHRGWVEGVAFLDNDRQGLSAGRDGRILRWDFTTSQITAEMIQGNWIHALACSPNGQTAYAAGDDGKIHCWDLHTNQQKGELSGHAQPILALSLSPDGQRLVSASGDNTLLIWDAK